MAVARELTQHGVSLRRAHAALNRIVEGRSAAIEITSAAEAPIAALATLGVSAVAIAVPELRARDVREHLDLSQAEFALRFGLELRTVQNWERDRYALDAASKVLLAVIERAPDAVEGALSGGPSPREPRPLNRALSGQIVSDTLSEGQEPGRARRRHGGRTAP